MAQAPPPATATAVTTGQRRAVAAPVAQGGQQAAAPTQARLARARQPLPGDGETLVKKYEAERDAIQQEAAKKMDAERASVIKSLEALQEQYTKAGKLDEAVAIRDYVQMLSNDRQVLRNTIIRRAPR
jgi:hypothetical protein